MFLFKKKYFFIIESIKDINLKNIKNFGKYNIIYRNDSPENIEKLKKFRLDCKVKRISFFIANNVQLLKILEADGLYISAFNKKLNTNYLKYNFKIIGSAHNIKEIRFKRLQGCSEIILSRLFKTTYKNKKGFLGFVRFNLLTKLIKIPLTPLGGINLTNFKKLKDVNSDNIALSSLIKERTFNIQRSLR